METVTIKIGGKEYKVQVAKTDEEKRKGLQGISKLPENEGMLFCFDDSKNSSMTMKDTLIPLDQIFINDDQEVTYVITREPNDKGLVTVPDTVYVLEVNANSGIKTGDELEFKDDIEEGSPVMKVLALDGSTQMPLWGGERIISRRETRILIKKAKKADKSKKESDYKSLGRYIFKVLNGQDNRPAEYVKQSVSSNKD